MEELQHATDISIFIFILIPVAIASLTTILVGSEWRRRTPIDFADRLIILKNFHPSMIYHHELCMMNQQQPQSQEATRASCGCETKSEIN